MRATSPSAGALRAAGLASAAAGVALLVLLAPHRVPWDVSLLDGPAGTGPRLPSSVAFGAAMVAIAAAARFLRVRWPRSAAAWIALAVLVVGLWPSDRGGEIVASLGLGTLATLLIVAGLSPWWRGEGGALDRLRRFCLRLLDRPASRVFDLALFAWVAIAGSVAGALLFGHLPHVIDGMVQLLHAKMLLQGGLTAPVPEPLEFFHVSHMIERGRWCSQYPPGHVVALALGQALRVPWLVNPVAAGLAVVLTRRAGALLYDERTGRVAALLAAASPFLVLTSASYMNHATTWLCLSIFLWAMARLHRHGRLPDAAIAGLALGAAATIRPWTAAALALPLGVAVLLDRWGAARRLPTLAVLGLALVPSLVGLLAWNGATTGDPLQFGYVALHGDDHLPGFGRTGFLDEPHTAARGVSFTLRNLNALNQYLYGWPLPSLALPLLGLLAVRRRATDLWLAAAALGPVVAYFFYWYQDWAYGPRFYFETISLWTLLSARGLLALPERLHALRPSVSRPAWSRATALALTACAIYAATATAPMLAAFYSRNFGDGNRRAVADAGEAGLDDAVVFVPSRLWTAFFFLNRPTLDGPVVFARDLGPVRDRTLMERYPGRAGYRLLSLDRYRPLPLGSGPPVDAPVYPVPAGRPWAVEFTVEQTVPLEAGFVTDQRTGGFGPGWRNHDQLLATDSRPGAAAGLTLRFERDETRDVTLAVGRGPGHGRVEISLDGRPLSGPVDLYAATPGVERLRFERVRFAAGDRRLLVRVIDRDPRAADYGLALDELRLGSPR